MRGFFASFVGLIRGNQSTEWNLFRCSLILCLAFILGTGPNVQAYVLALIKSDSTSIYGTSYHNDLIRFLPLQNWLLALTFGIAFPMPQAFVIAIATGWQTAPRKIFIATLAASFLVLMLTDLIGALWVQKLTVGYFLENVISNFLGSIFLSFLVLFLFWLWEFVYEHSYSLWSARLVAPLLFILIGSSFSIIAYYTAELFYRPIPVRTVAVLEPPIASMAAYHIEDLDESRDKNRAPSFSFFPKSVSNGKMRLRTGGGKLKGHWNALTPNARYDVTVSFFEGCEILDANFKLPESNTPFVLTDVHELDIWFDDDSSHAVTYNPKGWSGKIALDNDDNWPRFNVKSSSDGSKLFDVTQVVDSDARSRLGDDSGHVAFYFWNSLVDRGRSVRLSKRVLHLRADDKEFALSFTPLNTYPDSSPNKCVPLATEKIIRSKIATTHIDIGVLINVDQRSVGEADSLLRFGGGDGVLTISATEADLRRSQPGGGSIDWIAFKGKAAYLEINGLATNTTEFDSYQILGPLTASYEDNGRLSLEGTATGLWKNEFRLSPTKWEGFGLSQQGGVTAVFFLLIGLFGKLVLGVLSENRQFAHCS